MVLHVVDASKEVFDRQFELFYCSRDWRFVPEKNKVNGKQYITLAPVANLHTHHTLTTTLSHNTLTHDIPKYSTTAHTPMIYTHTQAHTYIPKPNTQTSYTQA